MTMMTTTGWRVPDPQNRQKEQKPFLVVSCIFNLCVNITVYGV